MRRLLHLLLPDRVFLPNGRLTRRTVLLAGRLAFAALAAFIGLGALGLLDGDTWKGTVGGAMLAWSVSLVIWALASYRTVSSDIRQALERSAELDLIHARFNHLAAAIGAPLLNLNEGELQDAVAVRFERKAHLNGIEEFGEISIQEGHQWWDNTACGYPSD